jgi:predicted nucleic acid-binding protein
VAVFVDTSFLIALMHAVDAHHARAVGAIDAAGGDQR